MSTETERAKRGLATESGFEHAGEACVMSDGNPGVVFHVTKPYGAADSEVFAMCSGDDGEGNDDTWWERTQEATARNVAGFVKIIPCAHCEKPAKRLDHLWPYEIGMNACDGHLGAGCAA